MSNIMGSIARWVHVYVDSYIGRSEARRERWIRLDVGINNFMGWSFTLMLLLGCRVQCQMCSMSALKSLLSVEQFRAVFDAVSEVEAECVPNWQILVVYDYFDLSLRQEGGHGEWIYPSLTHF